MGKAIRCAGCDKCLSDYRGIQIPGEVYCASGIYNSKNVTLCRKCSEFEDKEIDRLGTNDLPELLKIYQQKKP